MRLIWQFPQFLVQGNLRLFEPTLRCVLDLNQNNPQFGIEGVQQSLTVEVGFEAWRCRSVGTRKRQRSSKQKFALQGVVWCGWLVGWLVG